MGKVNSKARSRSKLKRLACFSKSNGDALITNNSSAPAALANRAGSSCQMSSQINKPSWTP